MEKKFELKSDILGPEKHMKQEVKFLNRKIRWGEMAASTKVTRNMSR